MSNESVAMAKRTVRTAALVARDRITRPVARTRDDVPGSVRLLSKDYLTAILCADHPGARVESFLLEDGSKGTHERRRIRLQYNPEGEARNLPETVYTKSLPSLVTRMLVGYLGHSRFEMLFYNQIRPGLEIETPTCYFSASDKETLAAIHVLEDVCATKQAVFGDEKTYVDKDMAGDIVDVMADLHASHMGSERLNGELSWLVDYPRWFRKGIEKVHTDKYLEQALTLASDVVPDSLLRRRSEIWPAVMKCLDIHDREPRTVLHSDCHIANWYVTGDGRMGLTDWQCVTQGHWSRDLPYALTTALTTRDRRAWEQDLLRRYLDRLADGCGLRVEFDVAWRWYRQQLLHALTDWTQTLCHPRVMPNSHDAHLTYTMINRITTAMADLETLDSF
jgi:hypothetical protein